MMLPNQALQRMNTSVAALPQSFTAERQGRWAASVKGEHDG
jgi:hypothetical protein